MLKHFSISGLIMNEYRAAVESYALYKTNYLFHNEGAEHALIIFENIFKNANSCIRIAANNLWNDEVVNTKAYINAIVHFLDKDKTQLKIILTNFPEQEELRTTEQNNFYLTLYKHPAYREGRITIVDGEGKSFKFKKENKTIHFCTADSLMYRLEDDIEHRKAIGNFGDSQTAKELETVFDQAFNSGLKKIHLNEIFN